MAKTPEGSVDIVDFRAYAIRKSVEEREASQRISPAEKADLVMDNLAWRLARHGIVLALVALTARLLRE